MLVSKEYIIPSQARVVFVADLFIEDYVGGAELTTEAIIETCPAKAFKLHSQSLTEDLVQKNTNKTWILCNWSGASRDGLVALVNNKCSYSVVEYDYKYCKLRSSHLHKLQTGEDCRCHLEQQGQFVSALYKRAEQVFFMSEEQMKVYHCFFPAFQKVVNSHVLSSVWKDSDLIKLSGIRLSRKFDNGKWAVLQGGTWIKNQVATETYCKAKGLSYDLIGGMSYHDFLMTLGQYKGLVFHPAGFDTCPRLVIEAKLMGLELDLNDNVQHHNEQWFTGTPEMVERYLRNAHDRFWGKVTV